MLDAGFVATLSTVVDGQPWVPMLHVRDGDRILLHGSSGAGALRHVGAGAPAALCVVHVVGLVVAVAEARGDGIPMPASVRAYVEARPQPAPHRTPGGVRLLTTPALARDTRVQGSSRQG